MEEWRPVVGYEDRYEVSSRGRVRNVVTGRMRKISVNGRGYCYISLTGSAGINTPRVHQLVAMAFLGEQWFEGAVVNHKNSVKTDNSVENLEWCTQSHNVNHYMSQKKHYVRSGEEVVTSILEEDQILRIRRMHTQGYSYSSLAGIFDTCKSNIGNIVTRKSWAHV